MMLTVEQITGHLKEIAAKLNFAEPEVFAEKRRLWLHIWISTPSFEGMPSTERNNIIWREFEDRFDDETIIWISQCWLLTPQEKAKDFPAGVGSGKT